LRDSQSVVQLKSPRLEFGGREEHDVARASAEEKRAGAPWHGALHDRCIGLKLGLVLQSSFFATFEYMLLHLSLQLVIQRVFVVIENGREPGPPLVDQCRIHGAAINARIQP
jgi:hypothetical protein